jgi:hypothetical protein
VNFIENEAGRHNGKRPLYRIRHGGEDIIKMSNKEIIAWLNESKQTSCNLARVQLHSSPLCNMEAMATENQKEETRCICVYREATSRTAPKQPEASLFVTEKVPIG